MRQLHLPSRARAALAQIPNIVFAAALSLPLMLVLILAVGLVLAAGQARAAEAACGGDNLVAQLQTSAPEDFAKARAEAEATPNGRGLLWKVEKPGTAPSFLFGTMHVTDPRVTRMPVAAQAAFDSAATVVIETTDVLDPAKAQAALFSRPELTMFTDGSTLTSFLNPEDAKLVETELSRRGIPLALVAKMKPWMIAGMVAMPDCEKARKNEGVDFLDIKIAKDALARGKDLKGLESAGEQFEAMASLPIEFHMRGLVETIKLAELMPDIMATMTELYLMGDIALIMPAILASGPQVAEDDMSGYAQFEERILTLRNHKMAERAEPILNTGSAFIAVGAMHLPGEEGLVALLRDAGYTVTAVD